MTGVSALQTSQRLHDLQIKVLTLHTHSGVLTHFVEKILFVQRATCNPSGKLEVGVPKHDLWDIIVLSWVKQDSLILCIGTQSGRHTTPF